jgi:AsmA protein
MAADSHPEISRRDWHSLTLLLIAIALLCVLLPPLVNLSHFDRNIAASISRSLGRPVHVDHAGLQLLPTPALTLENFVVSENPAYGNEPVIRAASVTATLRVSSLWKRRIEISSISLDTPSINLTRNNSGDWNFKSILLQAASIPTAPTDLNSTNALQSAASRPRFPYIEANHARINFIFGTEKVPFSLTDSDLALWQAGDGKWHIRVRTTPVRTDMNLTDTGLLRVDGSLGHATATNLQSDTWNALPIDLQLRWEDLPLGELTRLLTGEDKNWRGELQSRATISGLLGGAQIHTEIKISGLRAYDVIPGDPLSLSLACDAEEQSSFMRLDNLLCTLPVAAADGKSGNIMLMSSVADLRTFSNADLHIGTAGVDASTLLSFARHTTARLPDDLHVTGNIAGSFSLNSTDTADAHPWRGSIKAENLSLQLPVVPSNPPTKSKADLTPIWISTAVLSTDPQKHSPHASVNSPVSLTLQPIPLPLGAAAPAYLSAKFNQTGYTLHLTGSAAPQKLRSLELAIPWLSDAITANLSAVPNTAASTHFNLTAQSQWKQP